MHRRTFLKAALAAAPFALRPAAFAQDQSAPTQLDAVSRYLDVNGKSARVFGLEGPGHTSGLELDASKPFDVALTNRTGEETLVHWHGLTPPPELDGVPSEPAPLMRQGETRRYSFPLRGGGTHWMHAHTLQEQNLLAAPLIVRTAEDRAADVQEVVVLLHDFSFTPATALLARLTSGASGGMHGGMGHMSHGSGGAAQDVNDIEFDAYLANDRTLGDPQTTRVENGGRIRLRLINGATATAFTIDTGGLDGRLIAVDGQDVQPIKGRRFPVAMGQRLDIMFDIPPEGGAFPLLALREGGLERTGIILATAGARIEKIAATGRAKGPLVGLDLEPGLKAVRPLATRTPDRRLAVTLSGGMHGYDWSLEASKPLRVRSGERVEVTMRNMSMMTHPMHLHGHHFQIVSINGKRIAGAMRDTVIVPHMAEVAFAFDADNPGKWAFHCHHLYHMAAGMMDFIEYERA